MMEDKKNYPLSRANESNQDSAISSIEDTIRFMEEKLFAAKKIVEDHSKSFIQDATENDESLTKYNEQDKDDKYSNSNTR